MKRIKDVEKPFSKVRVFTFFTIIEYSHAKICYHKNCKHNEHIQNSLNAGTEPNEKRFIEV